MHSINVDFALLLEMSQTTSERRMEDRDEVQRLEESKHLKRGASRVVCHVIPCAVLFHR